VRQSNAALTDWLLALTSSPSWPASKLA